MGVSGLQVTMFKDTWPYVQKKMYCDGIEDYVSLIFIKNNNVLSRNDIMQSIKSHIYKLFDS